MSGREHSSSQRDPDRPVLCAALLSSACAMLRDGGEVAEAIDRIETVLGTQVRDVAWQHGLLGMSVARPPGDRNANLFCLPHLLEILQDHAGRLPAAVVERVREATRLTVAFAERRWDEEVFDPHRDFKAYSNIFVLYCQALLLAGLHARDERLLRAAEGQWRRWHSHVAYYGIDEFCSPTYNDIIYTALRRMHGAARSEWMREQIRDVLDHVVALQYAIAHPRLGLPVCGASRDYRRFLSPGGGRLRLFDEEADGDGYVRPAAVRAEYAGRRWPHHVRGRATTWPFRFGCWQSEGAAVGTMTGGNYFPQQIHWMAAVGEAPDRRAVAWLPGGFAITNGFVAQRDAEALCVFARREVPYTRTQETVPDDRAAALLAERGFYRFGLGLSDGWDRVERAGPRLVTRAYGHTLVVQPFLIDGEQVRAMALRAERSKPRQCRQAFDEHLFDDEAAWFGCHVWLGAGAQPRPAVGVCVERADRRIEVRSDDGLAVRLFRQPAGEVTELYDEDWRTTPLLACPTGALWPGELAARSAARGAALSGG